MKSLMPWLNRVLTVSDVFDQMKIDGLRSFKIYNDGSLNTHPLTYQRNYNDSYKLHNPHITPPAMIVYCSFKWEANKNSIDKVHDPLELCDPVKPRGSIDIVMELQDLSVFCLL